MKCIAIIDHPGLNPNYRPPVRTAYDSDEAYHDAVALYDVPQDVTIPAGTVICDPLAWVLCYFDASGIVQRRENGRWVPHRIGPGVIIAEPIDDGCKAALAKQIKRAALVRKVSVAQIEEEVAAGVAASKAQQAKNAAALAAETPSVPKPLSPKP